jgi:hypothetical protein
MSTVKMQIRLAPSVVKHFAGFTPRLKGRAVAAVLTGASEGVNLHQLLASVEQLRKLGDNFNQLVHLNNYARKAGRPGLDPSTSARVREFLDFLDRVRGRA